MNNMKKALALVMSLALAASTFVVGAAYDDVPETHDNRIAINLLGDLGVMVGDAGTNDFRPEGTLKRSEAAAIVYRLRTGKTNADSYVGTTGFSDVSDSHWASGYINYCVNQGIIAGYPDGTFKPDQDVTYAEYIKMVVCALNLQKVETTTYIDMNTGVLVSEDKITTAYPTGYIALASDQQINEGIDYLNPNDKITRAEVAQGAYNAIFESYYKLDPKDADYVKDGTTYQHLAEQVFKLEKTTGVVTAFEDYTVGNGSSQSSNYFEVDGDKNFEYADFNPNLVGQEVYVWEKQRNSSSATDVKVVAVVATENNTVTTINTNDLKKDDGDWYYTDAEGKKQSIKKNELGNTKLMLNGQAYTGEKAADLLTAVAEKRLPMDLTFIDSDDSPKSPTVISIKVYAETEITSVTNDTLYIKNVEDTYNFNDIAEDNDDGRAMYVKLVDELSKANEDIFDLSKGSIDLLNDDDTVNNDVKYYDGIAKEDKVMIYADVNGVIDIRKLEEKEGTIKAMSGSKFKVDDEEVYVVAGDEIKNLMSTNNNSDAVAYIDPFTGYVVYVDEGVGSVEDYYYVHLVQREYGTSADFQLTAYDYEGNKVKLTFNDSKAQKAVFEKLGINADNLTGTDGTFQVVDKIAILDVNSKGEITDWKSNNTGDLQTREYDKDSEYNTKTGYVNIGGDRVEVKASSVVFGVTFEKKDDGTDNTEKIDDVKTYVGSFPKTTDQKTTVDYYLKKGDDDLKAALVHGKTKGGNTEFTNVTGYVVDEAFEYTGDDKGYAIYTIATKGEIKDYETEVVDDVDLRDNKDNSVKGKMIKFDLTTDNKILYSDKQDIEIVGITNRAENDDTFEKVTEGAMTDFTKYYPGSASMDEDEIYYGIVVESKDGKYVQLVDRNGKSIIVDYADDVKAYRIDDQKWDKATAGTTGNITDSNKNYTTFAAVRIVDGDDENDAAVTEIYTKTMENKDVTGLTFAQIEANGIEIVAGDKEDTDADTEMTALVNKIKAAIGTLNFAKDENINFTSAGTFTLPKGYYVEITGVTGSEFAVDTDGSMAEKDIAFVYNTSTYGKSVDATTATQDDIALAIQRDGNSSEIKAGKYTVTFVLDDDTTVGESTETGAAQKEFTVDIVVEDTTTAAKLTAAENEVKKKIVGAASTADNLTITAPAGYKFVTPTTASSNPAAATATIKDSGNTLEIDYLAPGDTTIGFQLESLGDSSVKSSADVTVDITVSKTNTDYAAELAGKSVEIGGSAMNTSGVNTVALGAQAVTVNNSSSLNAEYSIENVKVVKGTAEYVSGKLEIIDNTVSTVEVTIAQKDKDTGKVIDTRTDRLMVQGGTVNNDQADLDAIVQAIEGGTYELSTKGNNQKLNLSTVLGSATIEDAVVLQGTASDITKASKDLYVNVTDTDTEYQVELTLKMGSASAVATITINTTVTAGAQAAFEEAYAKVSSLTESTAMEDDLTDIQAALDAYNAIPSAGQGKYSSEKSNLDSCKTAAENDQKVQAAVAQYAKYTAEGGEKITVSGSKGSQTEITNDVKTAGEDSGTAWDAVTTVEFSGVSGQLDVTTNTQLKINSSADEKTSDENVTITFKVGSGNSERTATVTVVLDLTVTA